MKNKYRRMMRAVELRGYPHVDFRIQLGRGIAGKHFLPILIVALALAGLVGLAAAVADPSITALAAGVAPGSYVISCLMEAGNPNPGPCLTGNEIPVGTALLLNAHVTDSSGNLATRGQLIFQDCLLNGIPAPSIQCDSGTGAWSSIQMVRINGPEDIKVGYGSPSTPQTIGFRFRYFAGHGIGIANGISNSMDVTWF